jgi:hypothetical protein
VPTPPSLAYWPTPHRPSPYLHNSDPNLDLDHDFNHDLDHDHDLDLAFCPDHDHDLNHDLNLLDPDPR